MKNEKLIGIALVKEACPLWGQFEDGPIVMNTKLGPRRAKEVEILHGKTIGYMKRPCKECQGMMSQGILLIGVVQAKSPDHSNPYRSGNKWVVTKEYLEKILVSQPKMLQKILNKGACFFPVEVAIKLGFPDVNINA